MKNLSITLMIVLWSGWLQASDAQTVEIQFSFGYLWGEVVGTFGDVQADVQLDLENTSESQLSMRVATASVALPSGRMEQFVKSERCFDVMHFPEFTFELSTFKKHDQKYLASGWLTIKGVRQKISFPVILTSDKLNGIMIVNRSTYGIGNGIPFLKENVTVSVSIRRNFKHTIEFTER